MKKISIIIPAYNEEKRIGKTLKEYIQYFKSLKNKKTLDFEIIVVLNACKDNTRKIVEKYKCKELIILEFEQGGKGFAIIEGFKEALKGTSRLIGFVDADMATSPEEYYKLIKNIEEYDGIIGSRYIEGAVINPKRSWQRVIASRVFNFIIRFIMIMKYRDTQCGVKIFKRNPLQKILLKIGITKWAFDVDLLYNFKKNGFKIKEFQTKWNDKGYSKINLKSAGPSMFLGVIRLRILNSPFKDFVRLYDKLA